MPGKNRIRMPFKDLDRLEIPVGEIPNADAGIKAARHENIAAMGKTERTHLVCMIAVSAAELDRFIDNFVNTDMMLA